MRELAAAYHGPWDAIRDDITDADRINYALFESLLIEGPWNRGRAIVIGDAAHACPPTLALGAAMALEDAAVLAEVLLAHDELTRTCSTRSYSGVCRARPPSSKARCNWRRGCSRVGGTRTCPASWAESWV